MNFMTPALIAQSQDEKTVDTASEEWDQALVKYEKHLRSIRKHLPRGARILAFQRNPHDAQVGFIGFSEDNTSALIVLKLDEPDNRLVILEYDLLKKPEEFSHASLGDFGSPWQSWLYDELDAVVEHGVRFFTHSILFSGGQELKLSFRQMDCKPIGQHHGLMRMASTVENKPELQPA